MVSARESPRRGFAMLEANIKDFDVGSHWRLAALAATGYDTSL